MQNHYFGLGDNPSKIIDVWYAQCSDSHPPIIYVGGLAIRNDGMNFSRAVTHVTGDCPVCAAVSAARFERQEAAGEAP